MKTASKLLTLIALTALLAACGTAGTVTSSTSSSSVAPAAANTVDPEAMVIWAQEVQPAWDAWTSAVDAVTSESNAGDPEALAAACQQVDTALDAMRLVPDAPDPHLADELKQAETADAAMAHACENWDFQTATTWAGEANQHLAAADAIVQKYAP